ncbi:hypothetical protein ATZ36_13830 [Candidatus Endomicrobiellum trichonymphae]|uniref:Uncharacterized protein n=1 Tax=Endomicrobium trichonymphae TaxID=1408204 RepID=A0A1E5IMA2_ENDTX|nr:hypothetical protein ATZ36_13830 [Candidatus Endomicrobium trichonymphae]
MNRKIIINTYIKFDYDFNIADKSFLNLSGYSSDNVRFFMMLLTEIRIALRNLQRADISTILTFVAFMADTSYKEIVLAGD